MSVIHRSLTTTLRPSTFVSATFTRSLTTTPRCLADPPPGNQPPSAKQAGRTQRPVNDQQSSASTKDPESYKSGNDHPAKQPDTQKPSERSTGFGNVHEVKGGKKGLDARTDKQ